MSAGITLSGLATGLTIAGGINALTGGAITDALGFGDDNKTGAQAQAAADPFASHRAALGDQYAGMLSAGNNTDITQMPGYSQFDSGVMQPALAATQRAAASVGQLYSGGEQQALQKTAQQGYYGFMQDYMNRLAQGSGATNNPATAAGMGINQGNANQASQMQAFGGLATAIGSLNSQINGTSPSGTASSGYSDISLQSMGPVDYSLWSGGGSSYGLSSNSYGYGLNQNSSGYGLNNYSPG